MIRLFLWLLSIFLVFSGVAAGTGKISRETANISGSDTSYFFWPQFNVLVTMTDAAAALLSKQKESIIVFGSISGEPKPETSETELDIKTGMVPLLNFEQERERPGLFTFSDLAIPESKRLLVTQSSPFFYLNVASGRKSSESNLLDCSSFQGNVTDVQKRAIVITCRLIGEETERPVYGKIKSVKGTLPERVVRNLYFNFSQIWCREQELSHYLLPDLAQTIDEACRRDLIGSSIVCPIIPGNDYNEKEIAKTLKVTCEKQENPTCTATFKNFGIRHNVRYLLQRQNSDYLISDILDEQNSSFQIQLFNILQR